MFYSIYILLRLRKLNVNNRIFIKVEMIKVIFFQMNNPKT